jgi:hypothetical protein
MISILWISKGCSFLFHVLLWTTALCWWKHNQT